MNKKTKSGAGLKVVIVILVILLIILTLFLGFLLYTGAKHERDISNHLKKADKYILDLEYDEAIAEFKKAIKIDPKKESSYIKLAEAYRAKADSLVENLEYEEAIKCLEEAIDTLEASKKHIESRKIDKRIDELNEYKEEILDTYENVIYEEAGDESEEYPGEFIVEEPDEDTTYLIDPENEPNTDVYEVLGAASLSSGDIIVLTPSNFYCSGAVWCSDMIDTSKPFTIELDICADEGSTGDIPDDFINGKTTGADGIVINFASDIAVGSTGTEMGFCGYVGVELDSYPFGQGDPEEQHVALIDGSTTNHVAYALCGAVNDENWHHVSIHYENGVFTVYYDGKFAFEGQCNLDEKVYIGVTAATGSACNRHMIRKLVIK